MANANGVRRIRQPWDGEKYREDPSGRYLAWAWGLYEDRIEDAELYDRLLAVRPHWAFQWLWVDIWSRPWTDSGRLEERPFRGELWPEPGPWKPFSPDGGTLSCGTLHWVGNRPHHRDRVTRLWAAGVA